ncbi:MAG: hypothetical protein DRP45_04400 [Candidatus Zixiibacteriota bacterium]|nr:MAG: hypothetical protein DRP45_04400 [candidate division Zixibacteria bacterium]
MDDTRVIVYCAQCGDKISGKPLMQDGETYCSLECANLASGIETEEEEGYFEEEAVKFAFDDQNEDE